MISSMSETVYVSLLADTNNPRQKVSLQHVKAACDFLEASHAAITITSVGRYCEQMWKGPKAQSIRNSTTALTRYVQTRMGEQKLPPKARKEGFEPPIDDETVLAFVNLLKAQRDDAVRTKNRIIQGLRKIPGVPIDDLIASGFQPLPQTQMQQADIGKQARNALQTLFDSTKLAQVGLELYKDRLRNSQTSQILLEKPDVLALKALVPAEESNTKTPAIADSTQKALK